MQIDPLEPTSGASVEQRFGDAVRLRRLALGLSQKQLAEAIGESGISVDGPSISRLEKGNRSIRLAEAVALSEALGMDMEDAISKPKTAPLLRQLSGHADSALDEIAHASVRFITALVQIQGILDDEPDLLDTLVRNGLPGHEGVTVSPPSKPSDWLDWYERLVAAAATEDPPWRVNPHVISLDRLRAILRANIERVLHPIPDEQINDDYDIAP